VHAPLLPLLRRHWLDQYIRQARNRIRQIKL